MKSFNLSEWALNHRPIVQFLLIVIALGSILSKWTLSHTDSWWPPRYCRGTVIATIHRFISARLLDLRCRIASSGAQ
jgi:hypothetical protein